MFLQLHDNLAQGTPGVPDLILPDAIKVSNRQILEQAVQEGLEIATKELKKLADQKRLDGLSPDAEDELIGFVEVPGSDPGGGFAGVQIIPFLLKIGKFLLQFGEIIWKGIKQATKTINLIKLNNKIQDLWEQNAYNVQQLNSMSKRQIEGQVEILSQDMLNAQAAKDERTAIALTRFVQVYKVRQASLPAISQRTLLYAGGAVLAYLLLKK
jgi:hypothetical protein